MPRAMGLREFVTPRRKSPLGGQRGQPLFTGNGRCSARVTVAPCRMAVHGINIDAIEQPVELLGRQLDHRLLSAWPDEVIFLEAPQHQPETGAFVEQQFDPVASAVVEGKCGTCKWIELHGLLDQHHQAVDASPEVDRLPMQEDPQVCIEPKHQRAPNAANIAVTSVASCPEHSSSSFTPLGNVADSLATGAARGD